VGDDFDQRDRAEHGTQPHHGPSAATITRSALSSERLIAGPFRAAGGGYLQPSDQPLGGFALLAGSLLSAALVFAPAPAFLEEELVELDAGPEDRHEEEAEEQISSGRHHQ
jgi:hypothetical protein